MQQSGRQVVFHDVKPDLYADVDGVGGGVWVNFHRRRRRADEF